MKTVALFFLMNTVALFFLMNTFYGLGTAQQNDPPFSLVDMRAPGSNSITLRCRRNTDDLFDPQAVYFWNNSRLDSVDGFVSLSNEPGTVNFLINRRLEGAYSCGTEHQRSNSILLIGKLS